MSYPMALPSNFTDKDGVVPCGQMQQALRGSVLDGGGSIRRKLMTRKSPGSRSYVDLITDAILTSPDKRLTANEIYERLVCNINLDHSSASLKVQFHHMTSIRNSTNTIRHTLSWYKRFKRVQRGTLQKPSWWTVVVGDSELPSSKQKQRSQQTQPSSAPVLFSFPTVFGGFHNSKSFPYPSPKAESHGAGPSCDELMPKPAHCSPYAGWWEPNALVATGGVPCWAPPVQYATAMTAIGQKTVTGQTASQMGTNDAIAFSAASVYLQPLQSAGLLASSGGQLQMAGSFEGTSPNGRSNATAPGQLCGALHCGVQQVAQQGLWPSHVNAEGMATNHPSFKSKAPFFTVSSNNSVTTNSPSEPSWLLCQLR